MGEYVKSNVEIPPEHDRVPDSFSVSVLAIPLVGTIFQQAGGKCKDLWRNYGDGSAIHINRGQLHN